MSCPVDAIAWGDKNRVQLGTGKTHEWVLARTMRDAPTIDSVVMTAKAVMVKWFKGTPLDTQFADAGDAVDAIDVVAVSDIAPIPSSSDQRREQLDPIPLLAAASSPPLYVTVRFNYRGYAKSLPWPVWTASASPFRGDKLCPVEADWMLVSSKPPAAFPAAPTELGALDKLAEHAGGGVGDLAGAVNTLLTLGEWGLVAYLGVQAFYLVKRLPSARRSS